MGTTRINFDIVYENERIERLLSFVKDVYEKIYLMGNNIFDNFKVKSVEDDKGALYFEAYIGKCSADDVNIIIDKIVSLWEYQGEIMHKIVILTEYKTYERVSENYPKSIPLNKIKNG